jgi:hypothetical protein
MEKSTRTVHTEAAFASLALASWGSSAPPLSGITSLPLLPEGDEALIREFYRLFAPAKVAHVSEIMKRYGGDVDSLKLFLEESYGKPRWFSTYFLCWESRYFDATRALYDPHVVPPMPRVAPMDNLSRARTLVRLREGVQWGKGTISTFSSLLPPLCAAAE